MFVVAEAVIKECCSRQAKHWPRCVTTFIRIQCGHFFFQAEVGIRDLTVTGVQTCALPISSLFYPFVEALLHRGVTAGCGSGAYCPGASTAREQMAVFLRSEERRVGKECRCSWSPRPL